MRYSNIVRSAIAGRITRIARYRLSRKKGRLSRPFSRVYPGCLYYIPSQLTFAVYLPGNHQAPWRGRPPGSPLRIPTAPALTMTTHHVQKLTCVSLVVPTSVLVRRQAASCLRHPIPTRAVAGWVPSVWLWHRRKRVHPSPGRLAWA
jgi:hypothetical protein